MDFFKSLQKQEAMAPFVITNVSLRMWAKRAFFNVAKIEGSSQF